MGGAPERGAPGEGALERPGDSLSPRARVALEVVQSATVDGEALAGMISRLLLQEACVTTAMCANAWDTRNPFPESAIAASGAQAPDQRVLDAFGAFWRMCALNASKRVAETLRVGLPRGTPGDRYIRNPPPPEGDRNIRCAVAASAVIYGSGSGAGRCGHVQARPGARKVAAGADGGFVVFVPPAW